MPATPASRLRRILREARRDGRRVLLFGIGNELRADDAVGSLIAQDLEPPSGNPFHAETQRRREDPESPNLCAPARNHKAEERLIAVPVGTALENAAGLVTKYAADGVFLVDAVRPPRRNARSWAFYEPDRLDAFIHSTHSVPMRLLVQWWREERPGIEVHFLGIRIGDVTAFGEISPAVESARREIVGIFRSLRG